jgi:hypothetical protein
MEPLNDEELKEILREWPAPPAPAHLEARIFAAPAWWRWLLTGSIRIPVPALALALLALAAVFFFNRKPAPPTGLADFQPVKQLNVRVIRSNYEPR